MRIRLHPSARLELIEAAKWYEGQAGIEVAEDFVSAYEQAVALIASDRGLGKHGVNGTRSISLRRFPFWVIFVVEEQGILVLAIAHWRRRPFYWLQRA